MGIVTAWLIIRSPKEDAVVVRDASASADSQLISDG